MVLIIVSTPHLYRIDPPKNLKKEVDQKFWLKRECLARRVGSFWKVGSIPESWISDIVNVWNTKNKFFSTFFKNEYSQVTFYIMLSMLVFEETTMHVLWDRFWGRFPGRFGWGLGIFYIGGWLPKRGRIILKRGDQTPALCVNLK